MEIREVEIAGRKCIAFGEHVVLPVDRIKAFDFMVANGSASNRSVRIFTDDPAEEIYFAFERRDAVWEWLLTKQVAK